MGSRQQKCIPLNSGDRGLEVRIPSKTMRKFVIPDLIQELSEMHIPLCFPADKEIGIGECSCIFNIRYFSLANPFSEDITESDQKWPLLFLAVFELCQ